jgi:hypothetical protein
MKAFQNDLHILRYEEIETVADWDNRGKENIVRMMPIVPVGFCLSDWGIP